MYVCMTIYIGSPTQNQAKVQKKFRISYRDLIYQNYATLSDSKCLKYPSHHYIYTKYLSYIGYWRAARPIIGCTSLNLQIMVWCYYNKLRLSVVDFMSHICDNREICLLLMLKTVLLLHVRSSIKTNRPTLLQYSE